MDNTHVIGEQARLIARRSPHATVTILHSDGSTPRKAGKLIALPDGRTVGSIGGGAVERLAVQDALECLRAGRNAVKEYDLASVNSNTGMICGGSISVFIESYNPRPLLVMIGGGHVGRAVLQLADFLGYDTILLDDRTEGMAAEAAELAGRFVKVADYRAGLAELELPEGASYVIATPGHTYDRDALAAAIQKGGAYVGMIGSRKKTAAVMEALSHEGTPKELLAAVRAPIGLDLGGETPEEIALSIMAEVQKVRYGRDGCSLGRRRSGT